MDILATAKDLLKRVYDPSYPKGYVPPDKYDTKLDVMETNAFRQWLRLKSKAKGKNMAMDMYDYDLKGYWKDNIGLNPDSRKWSESMKNKGHGTDKYKKPNHPTFSTESKYSGVDGYEGGVWGEGTFTPSKEMKARVSKKGLFKYFKQREPGVELIWTED